VLEADLGKVIDRFYVNMTSVLPKQLEATGIKALPVGNGFLKIVVYPISSVQVLNG